jgi:hypothetical protein
MNPFPLETFYAAAAGVAGALIGLLFVAVSVAQERLAAEDDPRHRIRAGAALTMFSNALTVSLFALMDRGKIGGTVVAVSVIGLLFVAGSAVELLRASHRERGDVVFLTLLTCAFGAQMFAGFNASGPQVGDDRTISTILIICFLIGIARSWELIGGPSVSLFSQLGKARHKAAEPSPGVSGDQPAGDEEPPA